MKYLGKKYSDEYLTRTGFETFFGENSDFK
jgi:hypothetical protein